MAVEFDMLVHGGSWSGKHKPNYTFQACFLAPLRASLSVSVSTPTPTSLNSWTSSHSCTSSPAPPLPPPLNEVATDNNVTELQRGPSDQEDEMWKAGLEWRASQRWSDQCGHPLLWSTGWPCSHRPFSCLNSLLLIWKSLIQKAECVGLKSVLFGCEPAFLMAFPSPLSASAPSHNLMSSFTP